jgi:phenylacetate-CoA ligase
VVDPGTGRPLPDGERGPLAITHLDRRGTVLIRCLVGDVVSIARDPCPHCGRTAERIVGPVTRGKDLVKVKGMLVNPALLLARLQAVPGIAEFQLVVGRPHGDLGMDDMLLRLAPHPRADAEAVAAEAVAAAQAAVGVRPRVVLEPARAIYDPEVQTKATRFRDTR